MKLHIGGEQIKEGWKILNIQKKPGVDFVGDITDLSQFLDESIEEVYASHILEHVSFLKMQNIFNEVFRILKKGGEFFISVPDLEVMTRIFLEEKEPDYKIQIMKFIYGGQIDEFDFHKCGFWEDLVLNFLKISNFKKYKRVKFFEDKFSDTSQLTYKGIALSLNIVALKE
jgi:predicted SAM-dependent methyltransferase